MQEDLGGARYTVGGLHAEAGRVMAVNGSAKYGDVLYVFDTATGDEEEDRALRDATGSVEHPAAVQGSDHRRPLGQLQQALHRV
ncbi:hypothetical protein [Streptomyces sp. NPDC058739]|uniref:hypothetical protein n=1 Tax=Streptomyces sp. NPDC058739 TaxID=3346618 RepID=UPI0036BFECE9